MDRVQPKRKSSRSKPISLWDRIVFGAIAALGGVLTGALVAVGFVFCGPRESFNPLIVLFGGLYFFVIGAWRAAAAGEVAGMGLIAAAVMGSAELSPYSWAEPRKNGNPKFNPLSVLITVGFFLGALAVGFFT